MTVIRPREKHVPVAQTSSCRRCCVPLHQAGKAIAHGGSANQVLQPAGRPTGRNGSAQADCTSLLAPF